MPDDEPAEIEMSACHYPVRGAATFAKSVQS
jgi:hypothetical protein